MRVLITIPSFGPHGGLNIIVQWANRLSKYHAVYLWNLSGRPNNTWCKLDPAVTICGPEMLWVSDTVILTSPHSAFILDLLLPNQKCFLFLQMMEHLFHLKDVKWLADCKKFYQAPYPMFSISKWNMEVLQHKFCRQSETHYITNGIDLNQFPLSEKKKDGKTVLVENWESTNPTKDAKNIGPKVAERLRADGYRIVSYGAKPAQTLRNVLHEYHVQPNLSKLNELYEKATILIKATKYDARSTAPIEAMTKGTATARAIIRGDDDLIHEHNCLKVAYEEDELYQAAKRLLKDERLRSRLSENCIRHVKENCNWDKVIDHVNEIISE